MNHESRILQDMFIARKMDVHEFVERYNRLIEQEAEKHWEPAEPHEHI